jgi:Divergent InlB B-repeat domain
LKIAAKVNASGETYFFDNLRVEKDVPRKTHTLTTNATDGSISLNPPGGVYTEGTIVTVKATPNSRLTFSNWSGDLSNSSNPTSITIDNDHSITANFRAPISGTKNVLFLVGDATAMKREDQAVYARLQNLGYTVQLMSDDKFSVRESTDKARILTSASIGATVLKTQLRDVAVPVINWEHFVQDEYGFCTEAALSSNIPKSQELIITTPGHPLAAGLLAGPRVVTNGQTNFSCAQPGGSPIIIAKVNDGSERACIYAYETNAAMTLGNAPARRVHFFLQGEGFTVLNNDGLKLFDAAVNWATSQAVSGKQQLATPQRRK